MLFNTLNSTPITPDVGRDMVNNMLLRKKAMAVSERAFKVAQGLEDASYLQDYFAKEWTTVDHQMDDALPIVTTDLEELLHSTYAETGLRWRLQCLNISLGSLRKGDFGFIFARPETGKTTFLASEITNFINQTNDPLIWINNEEQGSKVMLRVYQAYFGCTTAQLMSNVKKYKNEFESATQGRFILCDSATVDKRQVEKMVSKYSPALVVYDQIDKIRGFASDRDDLRLGAIYQWARELAKSSHAAIGVSQADGHAEGVRYLTMEHVANAKTAKQAEADWILGIGKSHDMEKARFLNISKNKLLGDKDSDANLRHGKFEVIIEPSVARYVDVVSYK